MNPRLVGIHTASQGKLLLRFATGELREFDVGPYIARGGVFAALADPDRFAAAKVVSGSVEWPGEVDLSYDTLYVRSVPVTGAGQQAA